MKKENKNRKAANNATNIRLSKVSLAVMFALGTISGIPAAVAGPGFVCTDNSTPTPFPITAIPVTYNCTAGTGTLSGTTCVQTVPATIGSYTCTDPALTPDVNNNCTASTPAQPVYVCQDPAITPISNAGVMECKTTTVATVTPAYDRPAGTYCTDGSAAIPTYYANSPLLRKFVDTLPGLTAAGKNTFADGTTGEYIPLASPEKKADGTDVYPGSNYYVLGVVQHAQRMHSDLQKPTLQRSYVQLYPQGTTPPTDATPLFYPNPDGSPSTNKIFWPDKQGNPTTEQVYAYDKPHYLGPIIVTTKGTPVRIKMMNFLPTGTAGDHFLPVDTGLPGADTSFPQNRVAIHLHGGDSPWISDGTPHQWFGAVGDANPNKKGDRLTNVPDMPDPGDGAQTIFWPNDQSARLMWYHDHTFGLTRQNAYAGEAAGYLIIDEAELGLLGEPNTLGINKALPNGLLDQIPLIIQDKTFVPNDIATQDAKWDTFKWGKPGDMWFPHVYEPNILNKGGTLVENPAGRWDFGPTDPTWANTVGAMFLTNGEYGLSSPYLDGSVSKASTTPEAYNDTPLVNGVAYPTLTVDPKAYRVRFLNGANDRYWNLSLWMAENRADGLQTEVAMVPADGTSYDVTLPDGTIKPVTVPSDNRPGGVPDPRNAGPDIVQFGNEAGLLPNPKVHTPAPISLTPTVTDATTGQVIGGEVISGGFYLGGAERGDTVIDFSAYKGKTLILYNDTPAPIPGGDSRYDYYTDNPDQTAIGGAPKTLPGYGPNTRTVMQIKVADVTPTNNFDLATLQSELPKAYAASADADITQGALPTIDTQGNVSVTIGSQTYSTAAGSANPIQTKIIKPDFDPNFGRLIANFATDLKLTAGAETPLAYIDEASEIVGDGQLQVWRIRNIDADNHPIHFHLFNVKVLGRIEHGTTKLIPPLESEKGWKETVQHWPLQDTLVALQPKTPQLPFGLPDSVRLLDPTLPVDTQINNSLPYPAGVTAPLAFQQFSLIDGSPKTVSNTLQNFGWEYVWHCHILGHEENDLMRPLVFLPNIGVPLAPKNVSVSNGVITWNDPTPAGGVDASNPPKPTKGNDANEIGFRVVRTEMANGLPVPNSSMDVATTEKLIMAGVNTRANETTLTDAEALKPNTDYEYEVYSVNQATVNADGTPKSGETPSGVPFLVKQQPAAPASLSITNATPRSVDLSWIDQSSNEEGFVVEYSSDGGASWTPGAPAAANTSIATVVGLNPGVAYTFRVSATRTGFVNNAGVPVAITTPAELLAPTGLGVLYNPATATTKLSVSLNWGDASTAESGYVVQRAAGTVNKTTGAITWGVPANLPLAASVLAPNLASYTDTSAVANSLYQYQVKAVSGLVQGPASTANVITASTLAKISQLQASGINTVNSISFQWQQTTSVLATGYEIQRCTPVAPATACTATSGVWTILPTRVNGLNNTKFTDTGLTMKTTYSYQVRAINSAVTIPVSGWSAVYTSKTR